MTTKDRPLYVYRLVVEYPDGVDWRNPPKLWMEERGQDGQIGDGERESYFSWPNRRHYLSISGAKLGAERLRSWGCVVGIQRSERIEWVEP